MPPLFMLYGRQCSSAVLLMLLVALVMHSCVVAVTARLREMRARILNMGKELVSIYLYKEGVF
jgi:hypothetical protein